MLTTTTSSAPAITSDNVDPPNSAQIRLEHQEMRSVPHDTKVDRIRKAIHPAVNVLPENSLPGWRNYPLEKKFPRVPAPTKEFIIGRNALGEKIYVSGGQYQFDNEDPRFLATPRGYESLHDPNLKDYFMKHPAVFDKLVEQGLVEKDGSVNTTLKEFNDYRAYLGRLRNSVVNVDLRYQDDLQKAQREQMKRIGVEDRRKVAEAKKELKLKHLENLRRERQRRELEAQVKEVKFYERSREKEREAAILAVKREALRDKVRERLAKLKKAERRRARRIMLEWYCKQMYADMIRKARMEHKQKLREKDRESFIKAKREFQEKKLAWLENLERKMEAEKECAMKHRIGVYDKLEGGRMERMRHKAIEDEVKAKREVYLVRKFGRRWLAVVRQQKEYAKNYHDSVWRVRRQLVDMVQDLKNESGKVNFTSFIKGLISMKPGRESIPDMSDETREIMNYILDLLIQSAFDTYKKRHRPCDKAYYKLENRRRILGEKDLTADDFKEPDFKMRDKVDLPFDKPYLPCKHPCTKVSSRYEEDPCCEDEEEDEREGLYDEAEELADDEIMRLFGKGKGKEEKKPKSRGEEQSEGSSGVAEKLVSKSIGNVAEELGRQSRPQSGNQSERGGAKKKIGGGAKDKVPSKKPLGVGEDKDKGRARSVSPGKPKQAGPKVVQPPSPESSKNVRFGQTPSSRHGKLGGDVGKKARKTGMAVKKERDSVDDEEDQEEEEGGKEPEDEFEEESVDVRVDEDEGLEEEEADKFVEETGKRSSKDLKDRKSKDLSRRESDGTGGKGRVSEVKIQADEEKGSKSSDSSAIAERLSKAAIERGATGLGKDGVTDSEAGSSVVAEELVAKSIGSLGRIGEGGATEGQDGDGVGGNEEEEDERGDEDEEIGLGGDKSGGIGGAGSRGDVGGSGLGSSQDFGEEEYLEGLVDEEKSKESGIGKGSSGDISKPTSRKGSQTEKRGSRPSFEKKRSSRIGDGLEASVEPDDKREEVVEVEDEGEFDEEEDDEGMDLGGDKSGVVGGAGSRGDVGGSGLGSSQDFGEVEEDEEENLEELENRGKSKESGVGKDMSGDISKITSRKDSQTEKRSSRPSFEKKRSSRIGEGLDVSRGPDDKREEVVEVEDEGGSEEEVGDEYEDDGGYKEGHGSQVPFGEGEEDDEEGQGEDEDEEGGFTEEDGRYKEGRGSQVTFGDDEEGDEDDQEEEEEGGYDVSGTGELEELPPLEGPEKEEEELVSPSESVAKKRSSKEPKTGRSEVSETSNNSSEDAAKLVTQSLKNAVEGLVCNEGECNADKVGSSESILAGDEEEGTGGDLGVDEGQALEASKVSSKVDEEGEEEEDAEGPSVKKTGSSKEPTTGRSELSDSSKGSSEDAKNLVVKSIKSATQDLVCDEEEAEQVRLEFVPIEEEEREEPKSPPPSRADEEEEEEELVEFEEGEGDEIEEGAEGDEIEEGAEIESGVPSSYKQSRPVTSAVTESSMESSEAAIKAVTSAMNKAVKDLACDEDEADKLMEGMAWEDAIGRGDQEGAEEGENEDEEDVQGDEAEEGAQGDERPDMVQSQKGSKKDLRGPPSVRSVRSITSSTGSSEAAVQLVTESLKRAIGGLVCDEKDVPQDFDDLLGREPQPQEGKEEDDLGGGGGPHGDQSSLVSGETPSLVGGIQKSGSSLLSANSSLVAEDVVKDAFVKAVKSLECPGQAAESASALSNLFGTESNNLQAQPDTISSTGAQGDAGIVREASCETLMDIMAKQIVQSVLPPGSVTSSYFRDMPDCHRYSGPVFPLRSSNSEGSSGPGSGSGSGGRPGPRPTRVGSEQRTTRLPSDMRESVLRSLSTVQHQLDAIRQELRNYGVIPRSEQEDPNSGSGNRRDT